MSKSLILLICIFSLWFIINISKTKDKGNNKKTVAGVSNAGNKIGSITKDAIGSDYSDRVIINEVYL